MSRAIWTARCILPRTRKICPCRLKCRLWRPANVAIIVSGRLRYEGRIESYLDDGAGQTDVTLQSVAPDFAGLLETEFGAELRGVRDRIEFRVDAKHVAAVLRGALDTGAEVISVTPHRPSLESVFLTAVQDAKAADDGQSATPGSDGPDRSEER